MFAVIEIAMVLLDFNISTLQQQHIYNNINNVVL
jgi:hypothetical protein